MGIRLEDQALLLTLDNALALARSTEELPALWIARVERLGGLGIKTYIAALGGALLAKATDPRVDGLAQDEAAGPRGYSLRRAAEFLAQQNNDRYDLGAKGRWPLNNRPFLGGPARIDEFTKISGKARPAYEAFLDALRDLNRIESTETLSVLAAFLRVRMGVQAAEREAARAAKRLASDVALEDLVGMVDRFVRATPEGGKRAQALAAAVLDCAFDDVELQPINSPHPGDVRVASDGAIVLAVEAKQLPVGEDVALELSRGAAELGADLAMLLVIAEKHAPLDRDRVQRAALRDDGTLLVVCEGTLELISSVAAFSATSAAQVEKTLPGSFAVRLREIEISEKGQVEWRQLVEARESADRRNA
ncbi:MAG TPA: restriction endonuclease, SacI family [Solirubrobacterales bacterium]|nr:restriction endonuclease, SacI family [Solirubrobacterales bacterium]